MQLLVSQVDNVNCLPVELRLDLLALGSILGMLIDSPVQHLYLPQQLLYAFILLLQLVLHLIEFTLFVETANDLVQILREAHVGHLLVHDVGGLDG